LAIKKNNNMVEYFIFIGFIYMCLSVRLIEKLSWYASERSEDGVRTEEFVSAVMPGTIFVKVWGWRRNVCGFTGAIY
jgi:hypothetical protein